MNISINWLKQYIDLEDKSIDEIVDSLTTCGLEVEEVVDKRKEFENFVVGYVKERIKHPNADKLSLCKVFDGKEEFSVVCGAPNVDAGQKVAFAKVGAIIPNGGFEIKKAKIRGEESFGMICAEDELGLSDDHSGIMILDEKLEAGTQLADALGMNDVTCEIAITPNRADALSHWGIARDLAAIFNRPVKFPEVESEESGDDVNKFAKISIQNPDACPRYVGKVIRNIEIQESPDWLKERLIAVGSRPINNVVDVTNFILHELGQPLHAFDLDELAGQEIIVKNAGDNRDFVTLDSKERKLQSEDLMICDAEKAVAVAGVMGGENSEVKETTKNILIESAYFNPSSVRKTAKLLNLSTDASYRFERGCNPDMTIIAAKRAAKLIAEVAGGEIAKGEIDVYPKKMEPIIVGLRFQRIKRVLGYEIENQNVIDILNRLELKVVEENSDSIKVEVPPFRHDIEREIDLIEEVARIYGYDKIPAVERIANNLEAKIDKAQFIRQSKSVVSGLGFYEIITNSLLNEEVALKFGNAIPVLNPQSKDMSHLRPSLVPGMLFTIARNLKVKENNLLLYEVGHVFEKNNDNKIEDFSDFTESEHLLIAVSGVKIAEEWYSPDKVKYDFYDLKGFAEEFIAKMSLSDKIKDDFETSKDSLLEFGYIKKFKGQTAAYGGKIKSDLLKYFDISEDVYVFDFNLSVLQEIEPQKNSFSELLKYPKIFRDFAFIFDKQIKYSEVVKSIEKYSSKLLKNVHLFDIFESDSLGKGKKSLAFQLEYYDNARTLTEEEVEKDFWTVIERIKSTFNAELRGK